MKYNQIIQEGSIQIPEEILNKAFKKIEEIIGGMFADYNDYITKNNIEDIAFENFYRFGSSELSKQIRKYPVTKFGDTFEDGFKTFHLETTLHDIGINYPKLSTGDVEHDLAFIIYFRDILEIEGKVSTSSDVSETTIVLSIPKIFKNGKYDNPSTVSGIFYDLKTVLRHELMHVVQTLTFKNRGNDNRLSGKDYFNKNREYKPWLDSSVRDFMRIYELTNKTKADLNIQKIKDDILTFTAMKDSSSNARSLSFFRALKENDPEQYKRSIKEFTREVIKAIENL